jgi:hypothetical protein
MKTTKLFISAVSVFLLFFAATSFAQDSALKVAGFEGKVQVKLASSADWADAVVDQALNPNDAIKTGENGQAMLQFSDKSTIALKPNTEIIVEELVWSDAARKAGLNMPIGELRATIKKIDTPSDFKVRTPTAICGARGTVFYVMTTGTETRVFVTEGAVDFTNPASGNTYVVVQNMSAISEISGSVTEPRELTGDEKAQALAGWSGVIGETYTEPPAGDPPAGGDDTPQGDQLNPTPENPAQENKGQQESEASPI